MMVRDVLQNSRSRDHALTTRMVENSFSMIRQKQEHPTVAEYLRISSMMNVQLVREVSEAMRLKQ